jgi:glycosyltransferase involved in cell wall biosynthesis
VSEDASPRTIHIWVPDIESAKGGIQAFSRFFIGAVTEVFPDAAVSVFSKNDPAPPERKLSDRSVRFDCTGWWSVGRLRTLAYSRLIAANALRERPDLIVSTHVHFAQMGYWLQKFAGIPFAAVAHGVDVWGEDVHGFRARGMLQAVKAADRVLAVSNFTRDRLLADLQMAPERVGVLPNTFDEEQFVPRTKPHFLVRRFGVRPDERVILTVARLARAERYKGYDQVLRALPAVRESVPDVRYILAGAGPDRARIERLARELGVESCVTFAGYVPDHELPALYNLADVFAMPSKGEGFGIVFLEALACGKPVIAGNKDGSVDAVLGGRAGVLIDPDNVQELEQALILTLTGQHPLEVLRQPDELRRMVVEAYGFAKFQQSVAENLGEVGSRK